MGEFQVGLSRNIDKMKLQYTFVAMAILALEVKAVELPYFYDMECFGGEFDKCIMVEFPKEDPNRAMEEIIGVNKVNGLDTVFRGVMPNVPNSDVGVTIHDNVTEIMISTATELWHVQVSGDLDSGQYEDDVLPNDGSITWPDPPAPFHEQRKRMLERRGINQERAVYPSSGFKLDVHILYDDAFLSRFGSDVQTRITAVMTLAEVYLKHASLETVMKPNIVATTHVSGETWIAEVENLRSFRDWVNARRNSITNANTFVLFSDQSDAGGTIGIAWVGTVCASQNNLGYRTNINEYFQSDSRTAQIVVHEIGHNLNMGHDFNQDGSDRFTDDNQACTNIGGYMDYVSNPDKWSPCSVQDLEDLYNDEGGAAGFCLTPLTDDESTTAATEQTTENTESTVSGETTASTESTATTATTTLNPEDCNDKASRRYCRRNRRFCRSHSFYGRIVKRRCAKTCRACANECKDEWRKRTCRRYRSYCTTYDSVKRNCAKTCGTC